MKLVYINLTYKKLKVRLLIVHGMKIPLEDAAKYLGLVLTWMPL